MLPKIIGLTGKARSGKDTLAKHLVNEYGYVRLALADTLRDAALAVDPIIGTVLDKNNMHHLIKLSEYVESIGWEYAKTNDEVRRLLQRMGTEAGWQMHGEDLWIKALEKKIDAIGPDIKIVITDVRFEHEARWLHSKAGELWLITRNDAPKLSGEQAAHVSENAMLNPDRVFTNDSTIEYLYGNIDNIYASLKPSEHYRVSWHFDIEDECSPYGAALAALHYMRNVDPNDPEGANVFEITDRWGHKHKVDLGNDTVE